MLVFLLSSLHLLQSRVSCDCCCRFCVCIIVLLHIVTSILPSSLLIAFVDRLSLVVVSVVCRSRLCPLKKQQYTRRESCERESNNIHCSTHRGKDEEYHITCAAIRSMHRRSRSVRQTHSGAVCDCSSSDSRQRHVLRHIFGVLIRLFTVREYETNVLDAVLALCVHAPLLLCSYAFLPCRVVARCFRRLAAAAPSSSFPSSLRFSSPSASVHASEELLEETPVAVVSAPVAKAPAPKPVLKLVKPAIDPAAALSPATPSGAPVQPVLVPYNIPSENRPVTSVPDGYKSATIDPSFGRANKAPIANAATITFGATPKNFKKPAISNNIFGSTATVYKKAVDKNGCPCKKAVPNKYRYDTEFKPEPVKYSTKCCCKDKKKAAAKNAFAARLPVVAELKLTGAAAAPPAAPCPKPTAPKKVNISPEYYPVPNKNTRVNKVGCAKNAKPAAPATIVPEFKRARLSLAERKKLESVVLHPAGKLA